MNEPGYTLEQVEQMLRLNRRLGFTADVRHWERERSRLLAKSDDPQVVPHD